jgi:hypothetical protein
MGEEKKEVIQDIQTVEESQNVSEAKKDDVQKPKRDNKGWTMWVIIGTIVLVAMLVMLGIWPDGVSGLFTTIFAQVQANVWDVFIVGPVGVFIVASIIFGCILERLGLTDALIKLNSPVAKIFKLNPTVLVPAIYNILGDSTAASRIACPVMVKAGATKNEIQIALATLIQAPFTFSNIALSVMFLVAAGVNPIPSILLCIFLPILILPIILRFTLYRKCKYVPTAEIPRFTPKTGPIETLFGSAAEGMRLLILTIVPILIAIFFVIGVLVHFGVWQYITIPIEWICKICHIHPTEGVTSLIISPAVAAPNMMALIAEGTVSRKVVIGTFLLTTASMTVNSAFGDYAKLWNEYTGLKYHQLLGPVFVGWIFKLLTCFVVATILG